MRGLPTALGAPRGRWPVPACKSESIQSNQSRRDPLQDPIRPTLAGCFVIENGMLLWDGVDIP